MRGHTPHHRLRRARLLALAAAVSAVATGLAGSGAHAGALDFETPAISFTIVPASATAGQEVTMTAVVTSASAYPLGTVTFKNSADPNDPGTVVAVEQVSGTQSKATLKTSSFAVGTYEMVASFTPDPSTGFAFFPATSGVVELVVSPPGTPQPHPTETVLTVSPTPVVQGQHESLTATVSTTDGSSLVPTGGQVTFSDGTQSFPAVDLVNGVATIPDVGSFGAGQHELMASYAGDSDYAASVSDIDTFTVADNSPAPTQTVVHLAVSQPVIHKGDTVDLVAHITQLGTTLQPWGGKVFFYSSKDCDAGLLHGANGDTSAPVDDNGNAELDGVGSWSVGDYTLCASYIGSTFLAGQSGTAALSVLAPIKTTTLTLSGPPTAQYATDATFTAQLTDTDGAVAGKTVTLHFGAQSCAPKTDANGDVQCTFAATDTTVSTVSAAFAGDLADVAASTSQPFAMTPAPTTLTVTTLGPTTLVGTLVDGSGAPLGGILLTLSLGGNTCTATTSSSGVASCTIDRLDLATATLAGSSAADARYRSGTFSQVVAVPTTIPTTLRYTGATTGDYGDPVTLSALLEDSSGNGVADQTVTLTLGAQSCDATTASDGTASCSPTISQAAGAVTAAADFAGSGVYLASHAEGVPFTVTKEESTLALSAPATIVSGDTVTLAATLREDGTAPVPGRTVDFAFGGAQCSAQTDSAGAATCSFSTAGASGATAASASFGGDAKYAGTSGHGSVMVQLKTTLTITGPATSDYDDTVATTAHLVDQLGNAVAGAPVTFTLGGQHCTASTGSSGDVTCTLTPNETAGNLNLHAAYDGSGDVYLASSADQTFTVTPEETTLTLDASAAAVLQGSLVTFTAKLAEDGTTPVDGRTVTVTADNGGTCTGTTSGGVATCQIAATTLGPLKARASFASDGYYRDAHAQLAAPVYVYAPTPGGGMFVVGDDSAGGNVTFWGSQWWKANALSGGTAPSSFKGYALHASTTCGGTWSTAPGNSAPPPAGPLPSYIAVVVASSAAKSGAAISGTELHVVVVHTAPGYDGNPGHAGTGTVVATIC